VDELAPIRERLADVVAAAICAADDEPECDSASTDVLSLRIADALLPSWGERDEAERVILAGYEIWRDKAINAVAEVDRLIVENSVLEAACAEKDERITQAETIIEAVARCNPIDYEYRCVLCNKIIGSRHVQHEPSCLVSRADAWLAVSVSPEATQ